MGWKSIKDHYQICHQVAVYPEKGICIGSDRKSTRLNSSHGYISYAVFCLKKKKNKKNKQKKNKQQKQTTYGRR